MDLEKVLARVKMENIDRIPTLKTLKDLCMAFVLNIPFDTLDMFGGKRKVWDLLIIYQNIVLKNRGGFCCELNGILQWILKQLGFKVDMLKAYAYNRNKEFDDISDHMALMVTLGNGEKWLTDVGWGGAGFVLPLKMELVSEQTQANGIYRLGKLRGLFTVEKKRQTYLKTEGDIIQFNNQKEESLASVDGNHEEEWNIIFGFEDTPRQLNDFQEGHDWAQHKNEFLTNNALAVVQNEKGRTFFYNNLYYVKEYVSPEVIKLLKFKNCSLDEMYPILEKEFGIILDFELKLKSTE